MSIFKRKFIQKCKENKKFCRGRKRGGFSAVLTILLMVVMFGAAGFYVYMINNSAISGYRIEDLENKKEALMDSYQKLEVKKIELGQITEIKKRAEEMGMVAMNDATQEYLSLDTGVVAKR